MHLIIYKIVIGETWNRGFINKNTIKPIEMNNPYHNYFSHPHLQSHLYILREFVIINIIPTLILTNQFLLASSQTNNNPLSQKKYKKIQKTKSTYSYQLNYFIFYFQKELLFKTPSYKKYIAVIKASELQWHTENSN